MRPAWRRSAHQVMHELASQRPIPLAWGDGALAIMVVPREGHFGPEGHTSPVTCEGYRYSGRLAHLLSVRS
jgi:hypothetical protein